MRIAIHQPNFFPRLKVLQKLAAADLWVVLDNVQYCKREWQNRARIIPFSQNMEPFWITLPVNCPNGQSTRICDTIIADRKLAVRIERSFRSAFGRAPYWQNLAEILDSNLALFNESKLVDVCVKTTIELLNINGQVPVILYGSDLSTSSKGSKLMAEICNKVGANQYLADSGATNYLNLDDFTDIEVLWQHWQEPLEDWKEIDSWRNISSVNYLVREGKHKFAQHLYSITLDGRKPIE